MNILFDKTVLFIDLDGTLIKTASGNTFPKDCTDFIIRKEVLDKISERLPNLFLIGIVTNQGGIPQFISKGDFEAKVFVTGLYCSSIEKSDKSRKPNTGMLEYLQKEFVGEHDKSQMIMIGDASGKPGDFSDSDKKCAENFGIDYLDVDDFLNNKGI